MSNDTITHIASNGEATQVVVPGRKICIVGFASARDQAPYQDPTWELWGVNDVYAYVPRIDRTFELHDHTGLVEAGRRNPEHFNWMRKGKHPVYLLPGSVSSEFPSAVEFPYAQMRETFGRQYFTNSISLMIALAITELTEIVKLPDGREFRLSKPGSQLAMFGVDMAADTEYAAQRPSVEYFIGVADACGIPVFIPDGSDICKVAALYGLETMAPLRKKLEVKIAESLKASQTIEQQLAQLQAQKEALLYQKGSSDGSRAALKHLRRTWTMPTDIVKVGENGLDRHGELMPLSDSQPSDHQAGG